MGVSTFYKYDALERRIQRAKAVSLPPAPTVIVSTTNFVYDGADVVRDLDGNGTIADYLNGTGIDNKLTCLLCDRSSRHHTGPCGC